MHKSFITPTLKTGLSPECFFLCHAMLPCCVNLKDQLCASCCVGNQRKYKAAPHVANVTLIRLLPPVDIAHMPLQMNLERSCVAAVLTLKRPFSSVDHLVSLQASKLNSPVAAVGPQTLVRSLLAMLVADVPHHLTLGGELHPTVFTVKRLDSKMGILMVQQSLFR